MALRTWNGSDPDTCNLCGWEIVASFVDGLVRGQGTWAIMCNRCHKSHGAGLGTGLGQRFKLIHGVWIDERDVPKTPISKDELQRLLSLSQEYDHIPRSGGFADPVED